MKIKLMLASVFFAGTIASGTAMATTSSFSPQQTQQIEQIVHSYLVKNPQILVEVSQALQQQQMAKMQQAAVKGISQNAKDIFDNSASPVVGNPQGNVSIVEFMDYQCPHCKDMEPIMNELIKNDSQLRVIYKELPIFGANSEYAAKAALASVKQGKFIAFHDALLKDKNPLTQDEVLKVAKSVGVDTAQMEKDMKDPVIEQQLKDNLKLAQALNLMGTPAIIVANRDGSKNVFIPGTTSKNDLQQLIAQMRK